MKKNSPFYEIRKNIIGNDALIPSVNGVPQPLVYADWIASGRLYGPIERFMTETIGPMIANTHTETTYTGTAMTRAYHEARDYIKEHVHASREDSLFLAGFGMTAAINKLQRLLGLRMPEYCSDNCKNRQERPLVVITHMEHHSNQISWEECNADVVIIPRDEKSGLPSLDWLEKILKKNQDRKTIIGAFTACSNVTGIITPYHEMAEIVHRYNGFCFIDFAASAPYVNIDMHPENPAQALDAISFSPHKFLGGPGSSGVLVMNNKLYNRTVPDQPGGGTVLWTTPFGTHQYAHEIEVREDGGTPGFLQAIRIALAIKLKEAMGPDRIRQREEELKEILLEEMSREPSIFLLDAQQMENRLGIISFYANGGHHNLIVKLLNDRFGIQTRGGCSCAGTYGHILFNIKKNRSQQITEMINQGDLSDKPGWVRISLHPTMTDDEARFIGKSVVEVIGNYDNWKEDYTFYKDRGEFFHKQEVAAESLLNKFTNM